ncbi:7184_t:CDS:2, partial [Scutellospora calospora]
IQNTREIPDYYESSVHHSIYIASPSQSNANYYQFNKGDMLSVMASPHPNTTITSTSMPSTPSTPATPTIVPFHNLPFITGVSQSQSLTNRPRTLKFFPKNGRVGTRLTIEVYLELPNPNNVVLNLAFGDLMVETHKVALPESRYELVGIVPSQDHIKSANRSKVPVNMMICSNYNIPIDKWHLGDFVFKGCLYHPYAISNGTEPTSPTTSVTPPLKNEMLYNNSDAYCAQTNVYNFYPYGNHNNSVVEQPMKSNLTVTEQPQPPFELPDYREVEIISSESQSDIPSDPCSFYSSSASTPYSTASDDSFNETSIESPNLIYAQESSKETNIVPISPTNESDS